MLANCLSEEFKILPHFINASIGQIRHFENAAIFRVDIQSLPSLNHRLTSILHAAFPLSFFLSAVPEEKTEHPPTVCVISRTQFLFDE
jgi:hypothetical protein